MKCWQKFRDKWEKNSLEYLDMLDPDSPVKGHALTWARDRQPGSPDSRHWTVTKTWHPKPDHHEELSEDSDATDTWKMKQKMVKDAPNVTIVVLLQSNWHSLVTKETYYLYITAIKSILFYYSTPNVYNQKNRQCWTFKMVVDKLLVSLCLLGIFRNGVFFVKIHPCFCCCFF